MSHLRSIVWIIFACTVATRVPASAQGLAEVSAGPLAATAIAETDFVGWYADGLGWVLPGLGVVGEASGYYSRYSGNDRWHAALGGLRLDTRPRDKPGLFGQLLAGLAIGRQGVATFAVQPGLGLRLPLNDTWSLRVRADVRMGATEPAGAVAIGAGVSRSLGR
jgi:hypothetical protein